MIDLHTRNALWVIGTCHANTALHLRVSLIETYRANLKLKDSSFSQDSYTGFNIFKFLNK